MCHEPGTAGCGWQGYRVLPIDHMSLLGMHLLQGIDALVDDDLESCSGLNVVKRDLG